MAAPVIPCDSCGSPIPDSDLETGNAITLLGKRYCSACKSEAIQSVSLDDLAARPASVAASRPPVTPPRPAPAPAKAPARAASPPPAPAPKPAAPRTAFKSSTPAPETEEAPVERKAAAPRRPAPAPPKAASRAPLFLGIAAVVVLGGGAAAFFAFKGESAAAPETAGKGGSSTGTTPALRPADQARDAYAKVEALAQRAGTSWDLILAAVEKARPACRGTEWEKRLEDLRARATQEKENEEAARDLTPLIDELKGAVASDLEFKRFTELQPKFQLALEMASKTGSVRRDEIRTLQREYNGKYEKLAEPYYAEINEAAVQLAEEKRYDDALRKINTFPQQLRHSGAWLSLEKLKQDIERRKKK